MSTKILDNGTVLTLGLVGAVAAVGAANKAGFYGSAAHIGSDRARGSAARGLRSATFSVVKATAEESKGMYHPPVVIKVGKDRIVTGAGSNDDLAVFRYGSNLLLVAMNERMPYYGATLYTHDDGAWRVDQDVFLQGSEEVEDTLGPKWDSLKPATIANRLLAVMS